MTQTPQAKPQEWTEDQIEVLEALHREREIAEALRQAEEDAELDAADVEGDR